MLTPNEWSDYMDGWILREEDEWSRTRMIYSIIFNVNSRDYKSPEELIPLRSDKESIEPAKKLTIEECFKIAEAFGFLNEFESDQKKHFG